MHAVAMAVDTYLFVGSDCLTQWSLPSTPAKTYSKSAVGSVRTSRNLRFTVRRSPTSTWRSANEARPLVKVYTKQRAAALFGAFRGVEIVQRQLQPEELPDGLKWTTPFAQRVMVGI